MVTAPVATEFSRFDALRAEARNGDDSAYAAVAREFEAVFLNLLLKSARETTFQTGLMDSNQSRLYHELFDQQIALTMAQRGEIGLAAAIERQLKAAHGVPPAPVDDRQTPQAAAGASPAHLTEAVTSTVDTAGAVDVERTRTSVAEASTLAVTAGNASGQATVADDLRAMPVAARAAAAYSAVADEPSPFDGAFAARHTDGPRVAFAGLAGPPGERQRAFLEALWPKVTEVARALDVPPSAIAAQAALESGWGAHVIRDRSGTSSHNLFGIKAGAGWKGDAVRVTTHEYRSGQRRTEQAEFRAYPSLDAALADYQALLSRPRYHKVTGQASPVGFAREIQAAGYATDPAYAAKVSRLAREIEAFGPTLVAPEAATAVQIW